MGMETPPSPEEMAKIEKERTLSDAELLKSGAGYTFDNKGNRVLEVTKEQFERSTEEHEGAELKPVLEQKDLEFLEKTEKQAKEGKQIEYEYDNEGHIVSETQTQGGKKTFEEKSAYDQEGNLTEKTRSSFQVPGVEFSQDWQRKTEYRYQNGKLAEKIEGVQRTRFLEVSDPAYNNGKLSDELMDKNTYFEVKDSKGRIVCEKNYSGIYKYDYSPEGRKIRQELSGHSSKYETKYNYDDAGRVTAENKFENGLPRYDYNYKYKELPGGAYRKDAMYASYDKYGNKEKERAGSVEEYNKDGSLIRAKYSPDSYTLNTYDVKGQLRKEIKRYGEGAVLRRVVMVKEYEYNSAGQKISESHKEHRIGYNE